MKPYYDYETKETYRYFDCGHIKIKAITGSIVIGNSYKPSIWYNEVGQIVKTEPFIEYVRLVYD